jgi:hypothetical protein
MLVFESANRDANNGIDQLSAPSSGHAGAQHERRGRWKMPALELSDQRKKDGFIRSE